MTTKPGTPPSEPAPLLATIESTVVSMGAAVQELTERQGKSIKRVEELTVNQGKDAKRVKRMALISLVGLALSIILMILGAFLIVKVNSDSHAAQDRFNTNAARITRIQEQQGKALCPVFDITLSNYNPKSPNALSNPALYERTFKAYETAATNANCAHHTRGVQK